MKGIAISLLAGVVFGTLLSVHTFSIWGEYAPPTCPMPNGSSILLPNPDDCSTFYQCVGLDPILLKCLNGTWFNPLNNVCDWPFNVPEGVCTPPLDTTTAEPNTTQPNPTEMTTEFPDGNMTTILPTTINQTDDNYYY